MKKLILALILSTSVLAEIPSFRGETQSTYDCEGGLMTTVTQTDLYAYEVYDITYADGETKRVTEAKATKLLDYLDQNCELVTKCLRKKFEQISTCSR